MKPVVLVVGSINTDMVIRAPRHPAAGETLMGSGFAVFPGGKGANQAVAAARLGGAVRLIGRVGTDGMSLERREALVHEGVDPRFILPTPGTAGGVAVITLDAAGQNTIVVDPGANARLTPQDLQTAEPAFHGARVLLTQLETPLETVEAALRQARSAGALTLLNPAPAQPLPDSLLEQVDFLLPNRGELALLTGSEDVESGAAALLRRGVRVVAVTLGESGVYVSSGATRFHLPAYPVDVVDTVAAGDAFVGAFGLALAEEKSLEEAAAWGNAAGALAVTRAGAQPSLPRREELLALMGGSKEVPGSHSG